MYVLAIWFTKLHDENFTKKKKEAQAAVLRLYTSTMFWSPLSCILFVCVDM